MRYRAYVWGAVALALGLSLSGCNGAAQRDDAETVDYYCRRCDVYVGDYDRATEVPRINVETREAMERAEAQGEFRHVADSAAVIVRQSRDMPGETFDPEANDVNRTLTRWTRRQYGETEPWERQGRQATYSDVAGWIREHRMDLGPSELLDRELARGR
jgi:hypothetical protein